MIKLIATDIDGTLVKDGTLDINPEYMTVIKKLAEKGVTFVACSGRQFSSEQQLFAPVKDKIFFISDGGTVIRQADKILKVHTLPDEIWKNMLTVSASGRTGDQVCSLSSRSMRGALCTTFYSYMER